MSDIPQVYARIVPPWGFQTAPRLIVDECPYCGRTHRHIFSEQHGDSFGTRMSDCFRGEYELIDKAASDEGGEA